MQVREGEEALDPSEADESILDLISSVGNKAEQKGEAAGTKQPAGKSGKGKGGEK